MPVRPVQPIVIWLGRVGDMILLSALLEALHRRYGAPCHLVGAGDFVGQLYAGHRDVERVSCLHRYTAFLFDGAWWRAWRTLLGSGTAPVYVCEYDPRKLARVRRLLRLAAVGRDRCLFLTDTPCMARRHWVDRLMDFARLTPPALREADYPWPEPPPLGAPRLDVTDAARADCARWLESEGLAGRTLVLVQPGNRRTMRGRRLELSPDDDKAWPVERWAALVHALHAERPEARIVLCGAPRETLLLGWIREAAQLPAMVAAELPLPHLLALCERAHSMISVDTGPAHAAAALSLPLVVLYGSQSPEEWLPRSPTGSPVVPVGGPPAHSRLDEIGVETVIAAWRRLPGRGGGESPGSLTP